MERKKKQHVIFSSKSVTNMRLIQLVRGLTPHEFDSWGLA